MGDTELKDHIEGLYAKFLTGDEAAGKEFAAYVRLNADVPLHAQQLLAYKIQSPLEKEAVRGLDLLEICVRSSGKLFHNEIGKYRFLNELIRVVSPKYLGPRSSSQVKKRIIEFMYGWTIALKDQIKIADAYSMLKKQGIVKKDPKFDDRRFLPTTQPKERCTLIKDDAEEKRLAELLASKNPEDIALANEMIKTMYEQDNKKNEREARKQLLLAEAKEKYTLMDEMIAAGASAKSAMASVYRDLESMRPQLFRLASEANENNDELMGVLRLTDEVNRVINVVKDKYPDVVELSNASSPISNGTSSSIAASSPDTQSSRLQDLGVDMNLLGLDDDPPSNQQASSSSNMIDDLKTLNSIFGAAPMGGQPSPILLNINPAAPPVSAMTSQASPQIAVCPTPPEVGPLTGIKINLSDFKASSTTRTLVEDNGVRVILIRGENQIPSRNDVSVLLVTFDSTNSAPIENLMFSAKVAKPFRIKLLQPSGNEFPAFNPVSSTSSRITQLILVGGRPSQINWQLSFDINDNTLSKQGVINL